MIKTLVSMKKNSLVQTTAPYEGRVRVGVVLQSAKGKLKVLLDDGISVVSAPTSRLVPFDGPLPAALESTHKVGDTVSFLDENGVEQLGVVGSVSVGSVKVFCNKGRSVVESVPATFTKAEHAIVSASVHHSVAAFRVRTFKAQAGHGDSPAFTAVIAKNGVDCIRVVSPASANRWICAIHLLPVNLKKPCRSGAKRRAPRITSMARNRGSNGRAISNLTAWRLRSILKRKRACHEMDKGAYCPGSCALFEGATQAAE